MFFRVTFCYCFVRGKNAYLPFFPWLRPASYSYLYCTPAARSAVDSPRLRGMEQRHGSDYAACLHKTDRKTGAEGTRVVGLVEAG